MLSVHLPSSFNRVQQSNACFFQRLHTGQFLQQRLVGQYCTGVHLSYNTHAVNDVFLNGKFDFFDVSCQNDQHILGCLLHNLHVRFAGYMPATCTLAQKSGICIGIGNDIVHVHVHSYLPHQLSMPLTTWTQ